jgi:hypothetical protein
MNAQTVNAHRGMLLTLPNVKSRSTVNAPVPHCRYVGHPHILNLNLGQDTHTPTAIVEVRR